MRSGCGVRVQSRSWAAVSPGAGPFGSAMHPPHRLIARAVWRAASVRGSGRVLLLMLYEIGRSEVKGREGGAAPPGGAPFAIPAGSGFTTQLRLLGWHGQ